MSEREELTGEQREVRDRELRDMVLSVALGLVCRCVDASQAAGLDQGSMADEVDAAGLRWRMRASFFAATMAVRITAHGLPILDGEEGAQMEHLAEHGAVFVPAAEFARLFAGEGASGANFEFVVPVAWAGAAQRDAAHRGEPGA